MQSPEVSHKRSHSSSTQPESNLSSNGSSSGAQAEISPSKPAGPVIVDRISLAGTKILPQALLCKVLDCASHYCVQ